MRRLKTTTAICLAVSLAAQGPVIAQSAQGLARGKGHDAARLARATGLPVCEGAETAPCVTGEGFLRIQGEAGALELCGKDVPRPCVTDAGLLEVDPGSDRAMAFAAEAGIPAEALTEGMAGDTAAAEAEEVQETPAEETATVEEAPVEETAEAETAEEAPVEAAAEAETEEQTPVEETAEAEPVEQAPVEETAEAETVDEAPVEETAEAPAPEDTPAEQAAAGEATDETPAEETAVAGTSEEVPVEETADAGTAEEVIGVEEAPAAAAAAEGEEFASEEVVVETEEVTEETARSASEDFETAVSGKAEARSGDDGLSDFEKALIIGIGAVVVGSILKNGDEVVSNSGDRVVLRDESGDLRVLKNDDALLRQPGAQVRTETFKDGSTRTVVEREDGTRIVTIRAADGRVVRRARQFPDGTQVVLFDDTEAAEPVRVSELPKVERQTIDIDVTDEDALRKALERAEARAIDRRFSLRQIRQIKEVRMLAPEIDLDAVTFATGSAAIQPSQAEELAALGRAMQRIIDERPGEVFLIEGHTDAVGSASYNLALSDRRAETVALALTEYFDVPPENMITQGYGESDLRIPTQEAERLNRRATVRRITPLLRTASK